MTTSLMPRPWYLQGVASGLSAIIGYAAGRFVAWVVRGCGVRTEWSAHTRRLGWVVLTAVGVVVVPVSMYLGAYWQRVVRDLVGQPREPASFYIGVLPVAAALALGLLLLGRALRFLVRRVARRLERFLPRPVARLVGIVVVTAGAVFVLDESMQRVVLAAAERSARAADQGTPPGVVQPQSPLRSGSPASLEAWETLGSEGRLFVASGTDAAGIEMVTGAPALEPIRVYAGREAAGPGSTPRDVAEHVVAELERTAAFDRAVVAVATTTGRGWVNEAVALSLETVMGGDTAIAAMQYSFLPSPVAFLADRESPQAAGRALLDAVHARLAQVPQERRPRLVVFGESLGSYGAQAAFGSGDAIVRDVDGALFVGTPNFAQPWRDLTSGRDPGSREILPVVDAGAAIRFAARAEDLDLDGAPWGDTRVVFWQHASDPVVWWSPDLLLGRPDWLEEPRGPDVDPGMTWIPVVTFWQVTMDMVFSLDAPDGHGHAYGADAVDMWAAILQPDGWTQQRRSAARAVVADLVIEEDGMVGSTTP